MELGLKNKNIVITGGTVGIGKACVDAFLAEGCSVCICARREDKLAALREAYAGKPILALQADIASLKDMENLAKEANDRFGKINVWVNNAGIYPRSYLMDMHPEEWRKLFSVNLDGTYNGCRAAFPYMKKQGGGVILNAASFATIMPAAGTGAYAISKAAIHQMTRVLAAELAPYKIRVATYIPGVTDTELTTDLIAENNEDRLLKPVAQRRVASADEIANVVVFLASDAASFITGTSIEASGGKYCVQNPWAPWQKAAAAK